MALGIDSERVRIQDDLRGLVTGDVLCDPLSLEMYASDASIYQVRPIGVIRPRNANDVAAVVNYAAEHNLSVTARGAGSGLAGDSLGRGLIIDFSRYLRRWRRIDADHIRVQPGLVLAELNRELAKEHLQFGPDPATRSVTTIGSALSVDASGSHWLRYGSARHKVRSLQVVLANGQMAELNQHLPSEPGVAGELARGVAELGQKYAVELKENRCRAPVNRAGYQLNLAVHGSHVDLARLLTGSEGTLGLITDATLKLDRTPKSRGVLIAFFAKSDHAVRGALAITADLRAELQVVSANHRTITGEAEVGACDMMDRRLLEIARETDPGFSEILPKAAEAMLLIEVAGDVVAEVREKLRQIHQTLIEDLQLAFDGRYTIDRHERDFFWRLSRRVIPRLYQLEGDSRPVPFVEDVAVPPESLPLFLQEVQNVLKDQRLTATVFCHAGHGQLHIRPFVDMRSLENLVRLRNFAEVLYEKVWEVGGTVCGEHASGLSRSWVLPKQFGPLWPAMVQCKQLFDPEHRLNPGKVVDVLARDPLVDLRPHVAAEELAGSRVPTTQSAASDGMANVIKPLLPVVQFWPSENSLATEANRCNGCGRCRTTSTETRMCPLFRVSRTEEASPRAKANLLRSALAGQLSSEQFLSDEMRHVADLCFLCHQCRLECPATVDIPKLVTEMKGQHTAANGLSMPEWLLTRLELIAPVMARLGPLGRWLLESPRARWVIERALGVSAARKLPAIESRSFISWAARRSLTMPVRGPGPKVVLFVDYFVNWHDTQLGRAVFEVMRENRIGVYVPPRQSQSWMPKISMGDLRAAKEGAIQNLRILADAVRMGYEIVTPEATAALCLIREYPNLVDSDDARLVAAHTYESCHYLMRLHRNNQLSLHLKPIPATVSYHEPCHVRALDVGRPGEQLLKLIPHLAVHTLDKGCSGMAGTWGLQRKNYRNSLRIGWPMITAIRKENHQVAAAECSACRAQIEHAGGRLAVHPVKLLAYAYGRLPELSRTLSFLT
jgi:FAD/FMN-containing dehydrogenase/Fe-S oxidoreductase